jgi:hypothetical protein
LTFHVGEIISAGMVKNNRPRIATALVQMKLPPADKAAFAAAATRDGVSLSAWLLRAGRLVLEMTLLTKETQP